MAARKTNLTKASVAEFLKALPDARMREDCRAISRIMQAATGARPRMWGNHLVGFGIHRSVVSGGRIAEWMLIAFAPRRTHITIYMLDLRRNGNLLAKLGPHTLSGSCLHVKRLSELRMPVLTKLIAASVQERKRTSVKKAAAKPKAKAKKNPPAKVKAKAKG